MVKYTNIQCIKSITVARVTFTVPVRVNKTNIGIHEKCVLENVHKHNRETCPL